MEYENERVYLTFQTTRSISELLKLIGKAQGISQPKVIEKIITNYIKELDEIAKEMLEEKNISV